MFQELVILLAEDGRPTGTAPKQTVHTSHTPLHRAFSCYVFNDQGQVLLTRRALTKQTWPGVWTNSVCGHPAPGESDAEAIERRMQQELGGQVSSISPALPDFRYRATDSSGVVENEICPVHTALSSGPLTPNPAEVEEVAWVDPAALVAAVKSMPAIFSPWLQLQVPALAERGLLPGGGS